MTYELIIEGLQVDIDEKISAQVTKTIDDINQFGSRNTSFSKTIVLPGTNRNAKAFGQIYKLTHIATDSPTINIGSNFNAAETSKCELRLNGLQIVKGIFRLSKILLVNNTYEYEGNIFGELGGFIASIGNSKLEDLDFSDYDHTLNTTNIAASWNTINGASYFYPLIDYGTYSTDKISYDFKTLRPALYVKEYIDKIFESAGYTYESTFLNTALFKSLIIPSNTKNLERVDNVILTASSSLATISATTYAFAFDSATGGNFIIGGSNDTFTWNSSSLTATISIVLQGEYTSSIDPVNVELLLNNGPVDNFYLTATGVAKPINRTLTYTGVLNSGDQFRLAITKEYLGTFNIDFNTVTMSGRTDPATRVIVDITETVVMNDTIPRGILQSDFFASIIKMNNLYITEDDLKEKHLKIEPYNDYYTGVTNNWEQKVDYSKAVDITPMGQLNGRFFEYKYKPDNDYYNEGYQKKYNQGYSDRLFDTGFPFSKDKQTVEIIFSPSVSVQYAGTDKVVPVIYKKSKGNTVDQEELMDSNIRVLFAKKITGVTSWDIKNGATVLSSQTTYGYAGHMDDPDSGTYDLSFGVPAEIFFTPTLYASSNLFNEYWLDYIAQIADKDSKLMQCYVYLKPMDFAGIDFSEYVFIGGANWRINKIEDFDILQVEPVRCELIKVI